MPVHQTSDPPDAAGPDDPSGSSWIVVTTLVGYTILTAASLGATFLWLAVGSRWWSSWMPAHGDGCELSCALINVAVAGSVLVVSAFAGGAVGFERGRRRSTGGLALVLGLAGVVAGSFLGFLAIALLPNLA